jgi:hypothetical protein
MSWFGPVAFVPMPPSGLAGADGVAPVVQVMRATKNQNDSSIPIVIAQRQCLTTTSGKY